MQKIAIIPISEAGKEIAQDLQRELNAKIIARSDVGKQWKNFDAFVFIGAMGICVRTIAPYIQDKHEDPAVVCVDSLGLNVISVLSGHIGGANNLTSEIAAILGLARSSLRRATMLDCGLSTLLQNASIGLLPAMMI